jgi:SAM-dependent methyltransferase
MAGYGFDPVPEAVAYAQKLGLRVVQAGMETADVFRGRRFDVVTLLNVLEHLADPVSVVREIKEKILKPGGVLVIDVPNEFNAFQLCAQKAHDLEPWWIAPPAHLNYFTASTLKALLAGAGYRVERMEASFPMEMFLLFGHNYVGDGALGRKCHEQRMAFELNLRRQGGENVLHEFYRSLAELNLGRQVVAYAAAD